MRNDWYEPYRYWDPFVEREEEEGLEVMGYGLQVTGYRGGVKERHKRKAT